MSSPLAQRATFPPRGWNSWDCFGGSVTETEVLANAAFMRDHLLVHGWDTVVIDIQWYEPDPGTHDYHHISRAHIDPYGRPQPDPVRFPSSQGGQGFAPLARTIHDMGLRLGLHLMRGIPRSAVAANTPILGSNARARDIAMPPEDRCPWNPDNEGVRPDHPASQAWYDSLIALMADWEIDFLKVDDVLYPPIRRSDISMLHVAIQRCGRPITLSLSPGKNLSLEHSEFLHDHAQCWRASDDLWDEWPAVREQFQRAARWASQQSDDGVADLDMLPLGRIGIRAHVGWERESRLTPHEQRTMMTLWSMSRSPLMYGGHLPDSSDETVALLCNDSILALGQYGSQCREIVRDGDLVIWRSTLRQPRQRTIDPCTAHPRTERDSPTREVRAVFNLGDSDRTYHLHREDLGLPDSCAELEDLWEHAPITLCGGMWTTTIPAHGCAVAATPASSPQL